jgi:hypothetical protein
MILDVGWAVGLDWLSDVAGLREGALVKKKLFPVML